MSAVEKSDRPLPSERMDAAAERLKTETTAPQPKRVKAPRYYVLISSASRPGAASSDYELLTREPISAPSRKAAITKAVEERGDPTEKAMGVAEVFVVIPADHWVEITRTLKPPEVPYVEEWA